MSSLRQGPAQEQSKVRRNQQMMYEALLEKHKEKMRQKAKEKLEKKVARYSFLDTSVGHKLSSVPNENSNPPQGSTQSKPTLDKDAEMKSARERLQRCYSGKSVS